MDNEGKPINRMDTIRRITSRRRKAEYTFTTAHGYNKEKHIEVNMKAIDNAGNEATKYEEDEENPEQIVEIEEVENSEEK